MARVVCIGECMVELQEKPGIGLSRSYGGDTLNTAVYLARLGVDVSFATALGDDRWSDEMQAGWAREGIDVSCVLRLAGRLPAIYLVETDAGGERRFHYWRDASAARDLFNPPHGGGMAARIAQYDVVYFSGISLSLYGEAGRAQLFAALVATRKAGGRVAFDTNFRPRGWPDFDVAKRAYAKAMELADIIFASEEDLELLYGSVAASPLVQFEEGREIVLKQAPATCRVRLDGVETVVSTGAIANVLDTTAAGDSFSAGYLAARLAGLSVVDAAGAGHALAGAVIQHYGAIIPPEAMPAGLSFSPLKREGLAT